MAIFVAAGISAGTAFIAISNHETDKVFTAITNNIDSDRPAYGEQVYLQEVNAYLADNPGAVVIEIDPADPVGFEHADIIIVSGNYYFPGGEPIAPPDEHQPGVVLANGEGN